MNEHFQKNKPLAAIICGFPRGGTTLLSEVLRQHPNINAGFEGGLLLGNKPSDFEKIQPYSQMLQKSWKIEDKALQYICHARDWLEAYRHLVECSSIITNKNCWIFDKTPKCMQFLPHILQKIEAIPCLVIVRDPRAVLYSWSKRLSLNQKISMEEWLDQYLESSCNKYMAFVNGYKKAIKKGYSHRILLVKYEDLCRNQAQEFEKIFDFIGLIFDSSYLRFNSNFKNVYGGGISQDHLNEYINYIPEKYCSKILKMTEKESTLVWDTANLNNRPL